ncbi:GSCOCG00011228001-RA-CDS [Cotesia congregata]|uniref:Uncharacterized protein n=1 Tax=Cotesia congregata TaxID=51543 RepID=A0A8J2HUK8_COTCN|nr:GSCOCG00011228001-RA-CDS [Cotesia congregata]CAG5109349.1 Protein of unknown function [Cotesia congregata]
MPDGKEGNKAGNLNWFQTNFRLERTASTGDLEKPGAGGKRIREKEEESSLRKDEEDKEVLKRSKLQIRDQEKKDNLNQAEMDALMKKLGELDKRIVQECKKVSDEVGQLSEEARKEREEFMKKWEEEKLEMSGRIEKLEKRLEILEQDNRGNPFGEKVEIDSVLDKETERRLNKLEAGAERKEREARRRNVIIKGINMNEGTDWKREVDRVWAKLDVVGGRKSTRRIDRVDKEGKGMVLVEMEGFEKKREVMLAKNKLKREIIRLEDDLTFEERRIRRIIIEEAIKERATGKSVKVGYMKIWVNGKLRIWDEAEGRWKLQEGNE